MWDPLRQLNLQTRGLSLDRNYTCIFRTGLRFAQPKAEIDCEDSPEARGPRGRQTPPKAQGSKMCSKVLSTLFSYLQGTSSMLTHFNFLKNSLSRSSPALLKSVGAGPPPRHGAQWNSTFERVQKGQPKKRVEMPSLKGKDKSPGGFSV